MSNGVNKTFFNTLIIIVFYLTNIFYTLHLLPCLNFTTKKYPAKGSFGIKFEFTCTEFIGVLVLRVFEV